MPGEWQYQAGGDSCDLSADFNVSISADMIVTSQESLTGSPAVRGRDNAGLVTPANEAGLWPELCPLQLITELSSRPQCHPTFVRAAIIWVRPSKYQQKPSESQSRSEMLVGHFIIFISPFFAGHPISAGGSCRKFEQKTAMYFWW